MGRDETGIPKSNKFRQHILEVINMIFVTVGTHEQQFNRLIRYVDELKGSGVIDEEVIIQTGFSTYEPKYCTWQKLYPYSEMNRLIEEARIVITHGGPSSFIMPLQIGKIPIVVPRQKKYDEHVNDHQLEFARSVSERMGNIVLVENIENLADCIFNYNNIICDMSYGISNNNKYFNDRLKEIVASL